jgi:hypothetical protein
VREAEVSSAVELPGVVVCPAAASVVTPLREALSFWALD